MLRRRKYTEVKNMKQWTERKNAPQALFFHENGNDNFVYEAVQGKLWR
jgi:hypothetical protein